jgi:hypothetical protein
VLDDHADRAIGIKRFAAGKHFVQGRAQGIHIGAAITWQPLRQLRGYIIRRAHQNARACQLPAATQDFGQSEISQQRPASFTDEYVAGLDITMKNAVLVRIIQCHSDLGDDVHGKAQFHWRAHHPAAQGATSNVLEHDVGHVIHLVKVIDRHNIGMVELRYGARFLYKAIEKTFFANDQG